MWSNRARIFLFTTQVVGRAAHKVQRYFAVVFVGQVSYHWSDDFGSNRLTSPSKVALSPITSCGTRMYRHEVLVAFVADSHHLIAAFFLSITSGCAISLDRFT